MTPPICPAPEAAASRAPRIPPPRRGPRMLSRRAAGGLRRRARSRARIEVPERLLRMTEFGLRHASADASGWWRRVELEMQALVSAHLPGSASEVRMQLDPERLEVVLEYEL